MHCLRQHLTTVERFENQGGPLDLTVELPAKTALQASIINAAAAKTTKKARLDLLRRAVDVFRSAADKADRRYYRPPEEWGEDLRDNVKGMVYMLRDARDWSRAAIKSVRSDKARQFAEQSLPALDQRRRVVIERAAALAAEYQALADRGLGVHTELDQAQKLGERWSRDSWWDVVRGRGSDPVRLLDKADARLRALQTELDDWRGSRPATYADEILAGETTRQDRRFWKRRRAALQKLREQVTRGSAFLASVDVEANARAAHEQMAAGSRIVWIQPPLSLHREVTRNGEKHWTLIEHLPGPVTDRWHHARRVDAERHAEHLRWATEAAGARPADHVRKAHRMLHIAGWLPPSIADVTPAESGVFDEIRDGLRDVAMNLLQRRTRVGFDGHWTDTDNRQNYRGRHWDKYADEFPTLDQAGVRPRPPMMIQKTERWADHYLGRVEAFLADTYRLGETDPQHKEGADITWGGRTAARLWNHGYKLAKGQWTPALRKMASWMPRHQLEKLEAAGLIPVPHGNFPPAPPHLATTDEEAQYVEELKAIERTRSQRRALRADAPEPPVAAEASKPRKKRRTKAQKAADVALAERARDIIDRTERAYRDSHYAGIPMKQAQMLTDYGILANRIEGNHFRQYDAPDALRADLAKAVERLEWDIHHDPMGPLVPVRRDGQRYGIRRAAGHGAGHTYSVYDFEADGVVETPPSMSTIMTEADAWRAADAWNAADARGSTPLRDHLAETRRKWTAKSKGLADGTKPGALGHWLRAIRQDIKATEGNDPHENARGRVIEEILVAERDRRTAERREQRKAARSWLRAVIETPNIYEPTETVVDWGSGRGQGRRRGGMTMGAMSDPPRGKKTYTDPLGSVPDVDETDAGALRDATKEVIDAYLGARSYGLDHDDAMLAVYAAHPVPLEVTREDARTALQKLHTKYGSTPPPTPKAHPKPKPKARPKPKPKPKARPKSKAKPKARTKPKSTAKRSRSRASTRKRGTPVQRELLCLVQGQVFTTEDIARAACYSGTKRAENILRRMERNGLVVRDGDKWRKTAAPQVCSMKGPDRQADDRARESWEGDIGPAGVVYDAEGRPYPIRWRALPLSVIRASNHPDGRKIDGYPPDLQARDRGAGASLEQVKRIAARLDPARLLAPSTAATDSAPIVWPGPDGLWFVVSGNGRTMALQSIDAKTRRAYLDAARAELPGVEIPRGGIVVREMVGATFDQAVQLAGASQATAAAALSALEQAQSVARGVGIRTAEDLLGLGPIAWTRTLRADDWRKFAAVNTRWSSALINRLDDARRPTVAADPHEAAMLAVDAMIGALPEDAVRGGLGDRGAEHALRGALPTLWSLEYAIRHPSGSAQAIGAEWSLLAVVDEARRLYAIAGRKGVSRLRKDMAETVGQDALDFGGDELPTLGGLSRLGVAFGVALLRAGARKDPEEAAAGYLSAYMAKAEEAAMVVGDFFAEPVRPDDVLGDIVRWRDPRVP